jgi:mRNA interferase HigB
MHVLALRTVKKFWLRHPDARQALRAWYFEARNATWTKVADVKDRYPSVRAVSSERLVFNVCGNTYRLIVRVNYASGTLFVRFVGAHAAYGRIKADQI